MGSHHVLDSLVKLLLKEGFCSGIDEARVIGELVLFDSDNDINNHADRSKICGSSLKIVNSLADNLDISSDQATELIQRLDTTLSPQEIEKERDKVAADKDENDEDDEEDGTYLVDGECELCDRYVKLTRHHLIPKETWPRLQTKLLHAAEAKRKGDVEKALLLLGPGLSDVLNRLSNDKASIREILHATCDICRQCHSTVHRTHSNMELALNLNTVEKLLSDKTIYNYCRWASKQKPGRYKR
mmetsp:Transcript_17243/g.30072  ORF Transcript_17243/g.30072 Transcript_17243/m.30072 type:complete len:243 (+) Transcript_17243:3-731(+)